MWSRSTTRVTSTAVSISRCGSCDGSDLRSLLRAGGGARPGSSDRDLHADRGRAGRCARARPRAPRRQALERPARRLGSCLSRRLRAHTAPRRRRRRSRRGFIHRHARLPRARATRPRTHRRQRGRLLARLRALRVPHRRAGLPALLPARGRLGAPRGGAAEAEPHTARAAGGDRRRRRAGPGQGARTAPSELWSAGRRRRTGARPRNAPAVAPTANAASRRCRRARNRRRRRSDRDVSGTRSSKSPPLFAAPNTLARIDPDTRKVDAVVDVGLNPVVSAGSGRRVWVYSEGSGKISEIDTRTNHVIERTLVSLLPPAECCGLYSGPVLAADASGAWFVRGGLVRQPPYLVHVPAGTRRRTREYPLVIVPTGVAVGGGSSGSSAARHETTRCCGSIRQTGA